MIQKLTQAFSPELGSGFAVAMIAIPLSLGIAVASHAPPAASLLTVLLAGLVAWRIHGAPLMVTGPAVGLALVVTQGLGLLGSQGAFSTAVVLAAILQLVLSKMRAGRIANLLPSSAIQGMMAAIGFHLILKQLPHALGVDPDFEGDLSFWEQRSNTALDLIGAIAHPHLGAIWVAGAAALGLWIWRRKRSSGRVFLSVAMGAAADMGIELFFPSWNLSRIELPAWSFQELVGQFHFPQWEALGRAATWEVAATLAVISSLETVVTLEALDGLTPERPLGDPDRSLLGMGLTNLICGLLGALPAAGLLIRSSINVYTGARNANALLWQVGFVALAWILFAPLLNHLPLAALAPCLIWVGYRLADRRLFERMWRGGSARFWPFLVSFLGVLFFHVIWGVLLGAVLGVLFILRAQHRSALTVVQEGNAMLIRFSKDASFLNKMRLSEVLGSVRPGTEVIIDATRALWIDQDIYELIEAFRVRARVQNIQVETRHMEGKEWKVTSAFS